MEADSKHEEKNCDSTSHLSHRTRDKKPKPMTHDFHLYCSQAAATQIAMALGGVRMHHELTVSWHVIDLLVDANRLLGATVGTTIEIILGTTINLCTKATAARIAAVWIHVPPEGQLVPFVIAAGSVRRDVGKEGEKERERARAG